MADKLNFHSNNVFGLEAIGHYPQAVEIPNGMVFISGQKAWQSGKGEAIVGSIEQQTKQVIDNIETILKSIGLELLDVVRLQCFLANISDYERFNEAYAKRLGEHKPVRCVVGNVELRTGALVELIAEAYRKV